MTCLGVPRHKHYMCDEEVKNWPVASLPVNQGGFKKPLLDAIIETGQQNNLQIAGNHFAMGCVALEITQRCNLDCKACYLSDYSQAVRDLPLSEILRRIDLIAAHYGPNTNVQITGGDPTLRSPEELIKIVQYVAQRKLRPALFTNGIKATRPLLAALKNVGLKDVAFHVDMTQERKGYDSEEALNALRDTYITRAQGLGLQIIFNTTIFADNLKDIPMLSDFFCKRANHVHLASFQMIADTGRGVERKRAELITQENVISRICKGVGTNLTFDFPQIGHSDCNRYAKCIIAGNNRIAAFSPEDRAFFMELLPFTRTIFLSRHKPVSALLQLTRKLFEGNLYLLAGLFAYGIRKGWALRRSLLSWHGRPYLITFYIHNFMHENALETERCKACVFMAITGDGPISMCVHNAKRNSFILQNIKLEDDKIWHPLGTIHELSSLPAKHLKGRARAQRKSRKIDGLIGQMAEKNK